MHLCSSRKLSLQILKTDLSFSYVPEPVVSLIALNLWENVMPPDSCSCTSPRLRNQEGSRGPGLGQAWYLLCTSCTHKVLSLAGRFISFNSFICKYERRSQGKAEWEESFCIFPPHLYTYLPHSSASPVQGWMEKLLEISFTCWPEAVSKIYLKSLSALTILI